MKSLRDLYKIGNGPSSSHTMGPKKACELFIERYPNCDNYSVTLYGSLALTGKGHLTDYIIRKTLENVKIEFDYLTTKNHPNTLKIIGFQGSNKLGELTIYSIGGGAILVDGDEEKLVEDIYFEKSFSEIVSYCQKKDITLSQYVDLHEDEAFDAYLEQVLEVMESTLKKGLVATEVIPGSLKLKRRAKELYESNNVSTILIEQDTKRLMAYAYAVSEENASGGEVVTAPTCGACGVLPATIFYLQDIYKCTKEKVKAGLKIAGLIGNVVKQNASISGAEAGCQAEVGTAASMAAAYAAYIFGGDMAKIERAAEIALEHHLGLTCDPVNGYVQIPCIERNAVAALSALDAAKLALYLDSKDAKISFDLVVSTMLETGQSLPRELRETSQGGLAKHFNKGGKNAN